MKFPSQKTSPANAYVYVISNVYVTRMRRGLGKLYEMRMAGGRGSKPQKSVFLFKDGPKHFFVMPTRIELSTHSGAV